MKKEAAIGTWKLSCSYLEAGAKLTADLSFFEHSIPAYFLFGHAIELAFKSFLVSQGRSESDLRRIGHDLEGALEAAYAYSSFTVYLSEEQRAAIRMLNPYYHGKELE